MPTVLGFLDESFRVVTFKRRTKCKECGRVIQRGELAIQEEVLFSEYAYMMYGIRGWRTMCLDCGLKAVRMAISSKEKLKKIEEKINKLKAKLEAGGGVRG